MYLVSIVLLLFVFPALSVIVEVVRAAGAADTMFLVGKWFVFWAAGVRLFIAGITQVARPQFTAGIFDITD